MVRGAVRVPEQVRQGGPTPGDARSNGARWDLEDLGDLGVVDPGEVPQGDRGAELDGELLERGVDGELVSDPLVERGSCARHDLRNHVDGPRAAVRAACFVERGVRGDAVAPRREARASVERVDPACDREQGFLRCVERVVRVLQDSAADAVDAIEVPSQERVERGLVAAGGCTCELVVVVLVVLVAPHGRDAS